MTFCSERFQGVRCRVSKHQHVSPHESEWLVDDDGNRFRYQWWTPHPDGTPEAPTFILPQLADFNITSGGKHECPLCLTTCWGVEWATTHAAKPHQQCPYCPHAYYNLGRHIAAMRARQHDHGI